MKSNRSSIGKRSKSMDRNICTKSIIMGSINTKRLLTPQTNSPPKILKLLSPSHTHKLLPICNQLPLILSLEEALLDMNKCQLYRLLRTIHFRLHFISQERLLKKLRFLTKMNLSLLRCSSPHLQCSSMALWRSRTSCGPRHSNRNRVAKCKKEETCSFIIIHWKSQAWWQHRTDLLNLSMFRPQSLRNLQLTREGHLGRWYQLITNRLWRTIKLWSRLIH
jgi:hypothetical protein